VATRTLVTEIAQEKFDVRTRKAVHRRETQRRILCDDRAPDLHEYEMVLIARYKVRGGGEGKRRTSSAARLHFSLAISCVVPCISGTVFQSPKQKPLQEIKLINYIFLFLFLCQKGSKGRVC
jgi:hypothetical protein